MCIIWVVGLIGKVVVLYLLRWLVFWCGCCGLVYWDVWYRCRLVLLLYCCLVLVGGCWYWWCWLVGLMVWCVSSGCVFVVDVWWFVLVLLWYCWYFSYLVFVGCGWGVERLIVLFLIWCWIIVFVCWFVCGIFNVLLGWFVWLWCLFWFLVWLDGRIGVVFV